MSMQLLYGAVARYLAKRQDLVQRLIERAKRTPYSHIYSQDGREIYMYRWWLFNAYETSEKKQVDRNWIMRMLPSIRLHHIVREDRDRHLHDHPWDAQTLILRGYYVEEREDIYPEVDPYPGQDPAHLVILRRAGQTAPLRFGEYHRIRTVSEDGVWTLFITFNYRGVWGFKVDGKKVPWREYFSKGEQQ